LEGFPWTRAKVYTSQLGEISRQGDYESAWSNELRHHALFQDKRRIASADFSVVVWHCDGSGIGLMRKVFYKTKDALVIWAKAISQKDK